MNYYQTKSRVYSYLFLIITSLVTTSVTAQFNVYNENFNSNNGGWVSSEIVEVGNWVYGNSSFAGNTTGHWHVTPFDNYVNDLDLWVVSPSLDFSGQTNMTFSTSIRYNTESRYDGAQIEYSLDGGTTWTDLGAVREGTNWYNDRDVDGIEDQAHGWSGDNGVWQTASLTLPATFNNQSNVKFRFFFASDHSVVDDGVAFDDIVITSGATIVYSENFNTSKGGWEIIADKWSFGTTSFSGNTSGHWFTSPHGSHNNNVDIAVTSPTVDLGDYFSMTLSVLLRYNTERGFDGAQIEYSIDGGTVWTVLGAVGDGTNWYNDTDVDGIEDETDGWSGNNLAWQTVTLPLPPALNNQSNVKLRVRFGTDLSLIHI